MRARVRWKILYCRPVAQNSDFWRDFDEKYDVWTDFDEKYDFLEGF